MLRTNETTLSFITQLYQSGQYSGDIAIKLFPKGSLLLAQGTNPGKVLVIRDGIAKCYFNEENGKNFILEFLSTGEILGELEIIKNTHCLCSVEAITAVTAFVLTVPLVKLLLEESLPFNQILLNELAERITNTSSRSSFQQLYSIEHGLKRLLTLQAKNGLIISKEDMAAYLGITLRSLNRLLAEK
jgi:CRP-like cAMP-binding protein